MTNKLKFLFLLTVSSLVSGQHLLGIEEKSPQNTTVSSYAKQYNNETELRSTSGPPQTTEFREEITDLIFREEQSATAPTLGQNTTETAHGQLAKGNGTSGNRYHKEGTETNSTKHRLAGNESLAGTESPLQTVFPEKNGSSDLAVTSSALTISASEGPRNLPNATNSVPIVVTTPHMGTDGPSRSRTTAKSMVPSPTETRTTQNHMSTKPHSTQKPDKSTTKVCPTDESKKESLVRRCLMVIGSLAVLAIIFIMATIILAIKLASNRYRYRQSVSLLHDTEMVCISALMNDSDHPIPTPKHPKSNGALIPITEDEDGDDLTLNSFLHDTEGVA